MGKPRNDLTAEYVRSRVDYDPETGVFTWKRRNGVRDWWNTKYAGKKAGRLKADDGRVTIKLDGKSYFAHRLAWLIVTGFWPIFEIDHRNLDPADNRFANLREATTSQNCCNRRGRPGWLKGTSWHTAVNKWQATIGANKKKVRLGFFDTQEEAHAAYAAAATLYHGEFARVS